MRGDGDLSDEADIKGFLAGTEHVALPPITAAELLIKYGRHIQHACLGLI